MRTIALASAILLAGCTEDGGSDPLPPTHEYDLGGSVWFGSSQAEACEYLADRSCSNDPTCVATVELACCRGQSCGGSDVLAPLVATEDGWREGWVRCLSSLRAGRGSFDCTEILP